MKPTLITPLVSIKSTQNRYQLLQTHGSTHSSASQNRISAFESDAAHTHKCTPTPHTTHAHTLGAPIGRNVKERHSADVRHAISHCQTSLKAPRNLPPAGLRPALRDSPKLEIPGCTCCRMSINSKTKHRREERGGWERAGERRKKGPCTYRTGSPRKPGSREHRRRPQHTLSNTDCCLLSFPSPWNQASGACTKRALTLRWA